MSQKIKSLLLPFYFGAIDDEQRTLVERELLTDSEILVDYLDLKRSIEGSEMIPEGPSPFLWQRLRKNLSLQKRHILPISLAVAIAVGLLVVLIHQPKETEVLTPGSAILFDSSSELPASSNVL